MKSYFLGLGVLLVLVAVLIVWRVAAGHRITTSSTEATEPSIDVMMDRHADDAVQEAQEKYAVALDYSPESVEKVDGILGRLHAQHVQKPFDERTLGRQSRLWGAYLGAVIKRVRPAKWELDSDVLGKGALPLVFGPKDQTFPCAWTYKRIVNGDEDNIVVKYQFLITERGKSPQGITFPRSERK